MGSNYHSPWLITSRLKKSEMIIPPSELDKAITYNRRAIISCDGDISYSAGTLTWSGTIRIFFVREDGQTIENTIASGSKAIADNEFAYVTLNETDESALTVSVATITSGAASNFLTSAILVLGYRNTTSDEFYPVHLPSKWTAGSDPIQAAIFYPGVPGDSAIMVRVPFAIASDFADDFAGSYAKAKTAATAETVLDVQKNDVSIGSITFAASGTTGTFLTSGGAASFAAGDILSIINQSSADATLADIGITFAGTR